MPDETEALPEVTADETPKAKTKGKAKALPAAEAAPPNPAPEQPNPAQEPAQAQQPQEMDLAAIAKAAGIDLSQFVPNDEPPASDFPLFDPSYGVYDYDLSAPLGLLEGQLRRIDEFVIDGKTEWFLVVKPTRPAPMVVVSNGQAAMGVATPKSFVVVRLFGPPQHLKTLIAPAAWAKIQVRPSADRSWAFFVHEEMIPKGIRG